jgi:hypothetical protein
MKLLVFISTAALAQGLAAQAPAPARASRVYGSVYDSIAKARLPDAMVQLVGADPQSTYGQTVSSDSLGRFEIPDVPAGRYRIGFLHPVLDSLGLEPTVREVVVESGRSPEMLLSVPSAETVRAAICGPRSASNSGAVILGIVRAPRGGEPMAGVTVAARWLELAFEKGGMVRRVPIRTTVTKENGWYAICNAPSPGIMTLMAWRDRDSTDAVDVQVPTTSLFRRELYLGVANVRVVTETAGGGTDSSARAASRRINVGDGRLSGVVLAEVTGRPLAGAQVGVAGGSVTRANTQGQWTLTDAPTGTRLLEVRAVGHYPVRVNVDVIDSAPPVRVSMVTLQSVLDTVKITAQRMGTSNLMEFTNRRRTSGAGRFLTAADIELRAPVFTGDIFRTIPGLQVEIDANGDNVVTMRSAFSERCTPNFYINGQQMNGLTLHDLETMTRPKDLIGVEIYASNNAPPQFSPAMSGCGSIVIWTR